MGEMETAKLLETNIAAARAMLQSLGALAEPLDRAITIIRAALVSGHKVLCCGNGGSAADSAHFATEIAGRYKIERRGFPAIDLTANHSLITALTNDYPPQQVFARQVEAFGAVGDVLVVFSTSGNSENVILAIRAARAMRMHTIALLGRDGGRCRGEADVELVVPGDCTAGIQQVHQLLYHTICDAIDEALAEAGLQRRACGGAAKRLLGW